MVRTTLQAKHLSVCALICRLTDESKWESRVRVGSEGKREGERKEEKTKLFSIAEHTSKHVNSSKSSKPKTKCQHQFPQPLTAPANSRDTGRDRLYHLLEQRWMWRNHHSIRHELSPALTTNYNHP
jgi:hypothetical protein